MYNSDLLIESLYGFNRRQEVNNEIEMPSALMPNMNNMENFNPSMQMNSMNMMPTENMNTNHSLFDPKEAYEKGNLFKNLYEPYKNHTPQPLTARNEQEQLLLDLSEVSFAAHDLNLYLNVHPEDESMIALFNDYRRRTNTLTEEYENRYGPLRIGSNALEQTPWMWATQSFPWEGSES